MSGAHWTNALLAGRPYPAEPAAGTGPLAGLSFSVKDVYATASLPTTAGSLLLEDFLPAGDAPVVARLRRAGARLAAKANCAEFGIGIHTETRIGGRVHHPFDPVRSPGGSSGGDAVAVAAGLVDFAVAGDYGGSTRWPAQSVGIYGLRTTVGLVPRTGRIPGAGAAPEDPVGGPPEPTSLQGRLEVVGLLARDPALLARLLPTVSGPDGQDWLDVAPLPTPVPRRGRLAVTTGTEVAAVDGGVAAALRAAVAAARAAGYEVVRADRVLAGLYPLYAELRARLDDLADLRRLVAGREGLLCPGTRQALASAPHRPAVAGLEGYGKEVTRVVGRVERTLEAVDALIAPVAPVAAVAHEGGAVVGNRWVSGPELMAHCRAVSLAGLPALTVPVRRGPGGATTSVQLVGPRGGDATCCAVAADLAPHLATGELPSLLTGRPAGSEPGPGRSRP